VGKPFRGAIFALYGNEHRTGGSDAVKGKDPQTGGTVYEDIIGTFFSWLKGPFKKKVPFILLYKFHFTCIGPVAWLFIRILNIPSSLSTRGYKG
jgi:hypothetical protein